MSRTNIYQQVMTVLTSEEPDIVSPSQPGVITRVLNRHWMSTLKELQRAHPWNFCKWRDWLTTSADYIPPFGWKYAYAKPPNFLRVINITEDGKSTSRSVPYEIEGGFILTDWPTRIPVNYTRLIDDPTKFDSLFTRALVYDFAAKFAASITGKETAVQNFLTIRRDAIAEARLIDSIEENVDEVERDDLVDYRLGNYNPGWDHD